MHLPISRKCREIWFLVVSLSPENGGDSVTYTTPEREFADRFFSAISSNSEVDGFYQEYRSYLKSMRDVGLFPCTYTEEKIEEIYRKFQKAEVRA